jgi:hypothetical protein
MTSPWLSLVQQQRAIAVIRVPQFDLGVHLAQAVAAGGMGLIEITWNSDRPAQLIQYLREHLPHHRSRNVAERGANGRGNRIWRTIFIHPPCLSSVN